MCRPASSGGSRATSRSTPRCRPACSERCRISACVSDSAFASVAEAAAAVAVAAVVDVLLGDPPNRLHPVAWMGRALGVGRRALCHGGRVRLLLGGAFVTLAITRVAARLDDALNFVPARLAALGLVVGAAVGGEDVRGAWRVLRRDGGRTASPNAGLTMAAMAGALGLTLAKRDAYRLGDGRPATAGDVARAVWVFAWAAGLTLVALLLLDSLALFLRDASYALGII